MMSGFSRSSLMMLRMRSSNCPRYFVPATTLDMSRLTMRLPNSTRATFRSLMRVAKPSTMALLPTPGSPISTGLFFFLLDRICARRSISVSRPTTGSSLPSLAARVRSKPNLSMAGVSEFPFLVVFDVVAFPVLDEEFPLDGGGASSSFSSSSSKSTSALGCSGAVCTVRESYRAL